MYLLTDCSVSHQAGFGIGGYLFLQNVDRSVDCSLLENIRLKRFEGATSSELELRTLLWALDERKRAARKAMVFTDSRNIVGLPGRRERLEKANFQNGSGERWKLGELYQQFFQLLDDYAFDVFKVKGHTRKSERSEIERLFSFLDRSVRKELRRQIEE